jgi:sodium-coupled neutral amino acid transporter 11
MFGQPTRTKDQNAAETDARQPLLDEQVTEHREPFSIEDEDSDGEGAVNLPSSTRSAYNVRFREDVQIIGPPLKSTIQSRETGVHLDTTTFSEHNCRRRV